MCSPVLAGGLAGYGAQQLSAQDKKPSSNVTNNYYGNDETAEKGNEDTPAKNKESLKLGYK